MKEYAKSFYTSRAWKECRDAYSRSVSNLCERCLAEGVYRPGDIVHHKIRLTPENIADPQVTLNFDNLELLCIDCHNREHFAKAKRYKVDDMGRVICK